VWATWEDSSGDHRNAVAQGHRYPVEIINSAARPIMSNQNGDYEFTQSAWTFRAEERVTVGVIRPTAICVVTGINPAGS
jgi:hypothetical protein